MIELSAEVVGENSIATRLTSVAAFLRRRLADGMKDALEYYAAQVGSVELGGSPIKRGKTGNLSKIFTRVDDKGSRVVGVAYPNAKSPSGAKYGFMLAAGTRKTEVWVIPGKRSGSKAIKRFLAGKRKTLTKAQVAQSQGGFKRRMLRARVPKPFMGPAYERTRNIIAAKLRSAVEQAMADANGGT